MEAILHSNVSEISATPAQLERVGWVELAGMGKACTEEDCALQASPAQTMKAITGVEVQYKALRLYL